MKKKISKIILPLLIVLIGLSGVAFSGYKLFKIAQDYNTSDSEYESIINDYVIVPDKKVVQEKLSSTDVRPDIKDDEEEVYSYLKIDWDSLKKINPDIVGWINIPGTSISYPVVQGYDNDTYIRTTVEGKHATAGSIFLNSRNSSNFTDYVSIIYGHNMNNNSMFGQLKDFLKKDFYEKHTVLELYTPDSAYEYSLSFVYVSTFEDDAYNYGISSEDSFSNWLKARKSQSRYKIDVLDETKPAITLSTCYGPSGTDNRCIVIFQKTDNIIY